MKFLISELDVVFANELPALERFHIHRPEELGRYARHVVELVENYISPYRVTAINLRSHYADALSKLPLGAVWQSLALKKPDCVDPQGAFGFFDGPGSWRNDAEIEVDFSWYLVARLDDGSFSGQAIDAQRFHVAISRKDRGHYKAALENGAEITVPGEAPSGVHRFQLQNMNDGIYSYGSGSRRRNIICESTGLLNRRIPGFGNLWLSSVDAERLFPRVERWTVAPYTGFGYLLPGSCKLEAAFRTGAFFQPEKGSDFYITNRSRLSLGISYGSGRMKEKSLILKSRSGFHEDQMLRRIMECDLPSPKKDCVGRVRLSIVFENPNGDRAGLDEKVYVVNPVSVPAVSLEGSPGAGEGGSGLFIKKASLPILKSRRSGLKIVYAEDLSPEEYLTADSFFLCTDKGPKPIIPPVFDGFEVPSEGGWAPGITRPREVSGPMAPPRKDPGAALTPPLSYNYVHNGIRYTVTQRFLYRDASPEA